MLSQKVNCPTCPALSHAGWDSSNSKEYSTVTDCPTRISRHVMGQQPVENLKPQVRRGDYPTKLHDSRSVPDPLGHPLTCGNATVPNRAENESPTAATQLVLSHAHPYGGRSLWDTADTAPVGKAARAAGQPKGIHEMTNLLAIDPGNEESGWVIIDLATRRPLRFGKTPNIELLEMLQLAPIGCEHNVIEMIASYGMPVGAEVFETCVWIGRFYETLQAPRTTVELIKRHPVKMHHCHNSKAKDSNITQALVDRFAMGQRNHGKGTKADPGWFYGFAKDVWQAYALAVYAADMRDPGRAVAS